MSCQEFITNLSGLRDGGNFPKELLKVRTGAAQGPGALAVCPKGNVSSRLALPKHPGEDRPSSLKGTKSVGPGPAVSVSPWNLLACVNSQPPGPRPGPTESESQAGPLQCSVMLLGDP